MRWIGFIRDERASTPFSLLWCVVIMIFSGLAIDVSNAHRSLQHMRDTADAASHAGAVAIANGLGDAEVRAAMQATVAANMPQEDFGNVLANPDTDIRLLTYDPETKAVSTTGAANTTSILLRRDQENGNALKTILLRVANAFGPNSERFSRWEMSVVSLATVAPTTACNSTNFIYGKQDVSLSSSNRFGADYCVHSQTQLWPSQDNLFEPGAGLSMPDLVRCGSKCTDAQNPGTTAASYERNLLIPDLSSYIARIESEFRTRGAASQKFFEGKNLDEDLTALSDAGLATSGLMAGSVVSMGSTEFEALPRIPRGLTYDVRCHGNKPLAFTPPASGETITDIALVTDCSIRFESDIAIESSMLISSRVSPNATISAKSNASVGTQDGSCAADKQTTLMAQGSMHVPADFAGSNVGIMVVGDVHFAASSSSGTISHRGLSLISEGQIDITSKHDFESCPRPGDGFMRQIRVIRHIML